MRERKIIISNKHNEQLVGIETLPAAQQEKYPAVILVHGFGVTKEEAGMFDDLADRLSSIGLAIFRFDFSGCGESQGDYADTSLTKLKSDLSIILKFVRNHPQVDSSRIGILGQSLGTSLIVALEPKVQSIVLMGSIVNPHKILSDIFKDGYNPNGVSSRVKSSGVVSKLNPQFWKDLKNYNLLNSITKIQAPILFIHGDQDEKVPLAEMEAYFEKANTPKFKEILKGADHGLNPQRDKMYKLAVDWFQEYLF